MTLAENLAEGFPSEFRISPSEFGEMVENYRYRISDGRICKPDGKISAKIPVRLKKTKVSNTTLKMG